VNKIDLNKFSYIQRLPTDSTQGQYPYTFIDRKSNVLVVTIGDSWTWGADITSSDETVTRLEKVYGGIISQELSADFLNLGQCGSCNLHIIERAKELNQLDLDYNKVYVICTLTEPARSLNGPYDKQINYYRWFNENPFNTLLDFHNSVGKEHLTELSKKVKLIIGYNFTDPIGVSPTLSKTWVEIYNEQTTQYEYKKPCYVMSHWVIDKLRPFVEEFNPSINRNESLEWISTLIDAAVERKKLVSDKNYYAGVNHPLPHGHKIWANYILENLNE
jgi:hypothetical protein